MICGYLILYAITDKSTDLISIVYLFFGMYYIVNFRKLCTQNVKMLDKLKKFNYLVITCMLVYQIPIFECPGIEETGNDTFITNKRCQVL